MQVTLIRDSQKIDCYLEHFLCKSKFAKRCHVAMNFEVSILSAAAARTCLLFFALEYKMIKLLFCVTISVVISCCFAQCSGSLNNKPLSTADPTLIRSTTNGKLYLAGAPGSQVYIAHLYGTPYEMGYAHGQLFKQELNKIMGEVFLYLQDQADEILMKLPKDLRVCLSPIRISL